MAQTWTSNSGNVKFSVENIYQPKNENQIQDLVYQAIIKKQQIGVVGSGSSITPVTFAKDGLIDLKKIGGFKAIDPYKKRVFVGAGTKIKDLGENLWLKDLALFNQAENINATIGGQIATGVNGSGLNLGNYSSHLLACRMITGYGEIIEINESQPNLLHAAQVSLGTLGVMIGLELEVRPKFNLKEHIDHEPYQDVIRNLDERITKNRHINIYWFASDESAQIFKLDTNSTDKITDSCLVETFNEARETERISDQYQRRINKSHEIYPQKSELSLPEMQYFIPIEFATQCFEELREFMFRNLPISKYPLKLSATGSDEAFLSPNYKRDNLAINIYADPKENYAPFFEEFDSIMDKYQPRVNWSKMHLLTQKQLHERYEKANKFIDIRRKLDPQRIFLNSYLAPLFA